VGKTVTDDKTLFEFLVLESAQAGLSWITILKKREGYRKAFCNFDAAQVAQMTDEDVERLMHFDGIVKNRLKIKSTITNAKQFLVIQKEFGSFYNYTLSFFPDRNPIINHFQSLSEIPVSSPESDAMSKDMKKRGFKFFGSTICYAHLQASGFINDHLTDCICRKSETIKQRNIQKQAKHQHKAVTLPHRKGDRFSVIKSVSQYVIH